MKYTLLRQNIELVNLKRLFSRSLPISACLLLMGGALCSCNEKTENATESTYMPSSTAAVTGFKLKAMSKVAANLDSVFFSIDLNKGVIFNADSLPVGTNIEKLIPNITYTSSAKAVKLIQSGGVREGEIDYKENPGDTVDFSGKVVLSITAEDNTTTRSYDIKVNVHKNEPDTLVWDRLAVTPMPSRMGEPAEQKTVQFKGVPYTLIKEKDGSYTMAVATDIIEGIWDKKIPNLDFEPQVRTMTAMPDCLCVLDRAGVLHHSADGIEWNNTGIVWTNIIGAYGDALLGLRADGGKLVHTSWPADSGIREMDVKSDFPVAGYSDFVQFSNRWTTLPIGFMTGGRLADGSMTEKTWGFDGDHWEVLSENMVPKVTGAALIPYFVYRKTSSSLVQTEFSVWMLIGGELEDGACNRKIYVSYDNGVNWYAADEKMQLPKHFPGLRDLDGLMVEWKKQASLTDNWKKVGTKAIPPMYRVKYEVEDYEIYWDCPYIYIFGGFNDSGKLNDEVWRGVLNRLTFVPLI